LKYRDEGYMYFPCLELLPFLKAVDSQVKEIVNQDNFTKEGSAVLGTISKTLSGNETLKSLFLQTAQQKFPEFDDGSFIDSVYNELVRKLAHTRIQEYLDSFKHKCKAEKGSASICGQNLRDSLLSHHVNLKSKQ